MRYELGVLQEHEARALLRDFGIYSESDDMRQRARELHIQGETPQAITLLESWEKEFYNRASSVTKAFIDRSGVPSKLITG